MTLSKNQITAFSLEGKRALVTGAAKAIGSAIAKCFAEAGATVYVHYRGSSEAAEKTVSEICAAGGNAHLVNADLTKAQEVSTMLDGIEADGGALDVLVNNAGMYPLSPLLEMTEEGWRDMFSVNLDTAFLCTRRVAQSMKQSGHGVILNIGSIAGKQPGPAHSHYNSAKAALGMFTRSAAQELGPHGIRVNCVSPGLIGREGLEDDWPEGVQSWNKHAPLGRVGSPEDVANACLFLASDAANWITGQELLVDGGMSAAPLYGA